MCVHSVYVEDIGLHLPLTAELQFFDCVISAHFSLGEKFKSRRKQLQLRQFILTCPPVKQRRMDLASGGGTKTASTYYTLLMLPYNTLSTHHVTSKQA